jgi:hypothetical protein
MVRPILVLLLPALCAAAPPEAPAPTPTDAPAPAAAPGQTPALGQRADHPAPVQLSAEWGKGISMKAGELFSLQLRSRIQVQVFVSVPDRAAVEAGARDEVSNGILIRRARLVFQGHAFTPKLTYYIQLGFSNRDMERDLLIPLRDAYITWQPLRDLGIRFGQMKVPYGKQRVVSSSALQIVDRSIVTAELNLDRDVGLYLLSEDLLGLKGRLMYSVGIFSGLGRNRQPGVDSLLVFGRIQINPMGDFDHLTEADLVRSWSPRLSIGLGAAHNLNTNRQLSTFGEVYRFARFAYTHYGADLHFKWAGLSVLAEVMYRHGSPPFVEDAMAVPAAREHSRSALGYFVQAGYVFPRLPFEVVGRWGELWPAQPTDPALRHQQEAGGGLNFYFWEHSLKLQTDYFYLPSDDPKATRHQWRLQAQLFF